MLLESLGLPCPRSAEGDTDTGRQEGGGLTKGSLAQAATISVKACEGQRVDLRMDGLHRLPACSSLGRQGAILQREVDPGTGFPSLSDSNSLFLPLQVLQGVSLTSFPSSLAPLATHPINVFPPQGFCTGPFPLPEHPLFPSMPGELFYPSPKPHPSPLLPA